MPMIPTSSTMSAEQIIRELEQLQSDLSKEIRGAGCPLITIRQYTSVLTAQIKRVPEFWSDPLIRTCWDRFLSNKNHPILRSWLRSNGRTIVEYLISTNTKNSEVRKKH